MGKMSREKGSAFERKVAKDILDTFAHMHLDKTDCYRTPMSGGHPFADAGDLVISARLWEAFPFVVECKHWAPWRPEHILPPQTQMVTDWISQARQAFKAVAVRNRARAGGGWLLVMRGNRTHTWCIFPARKILEIAKMSGFVVLGGRQRYDTKELEYWVAARWDIFLTTVSVGHRFLHEVK